MTHCSKLCGNSNKDGDCSLTVNKDGDSRLTVNNMLPNSGENQRMCGNFGSHYQSSKVQLKTLKYLKKFCK